jgi:hypothetical protein
MMLMSSPANTGCARHVRGSVHEGKRLTPVTRLPLPENAAARWRAAFGGALRPPGRNVKPTKMAQEVLDEIHAANSLDDLDEIEARPMPCLDDDNDDRSWIRDELAWMRKTFLNQRS